MTFEEAAAEAGLPIEEATKLAEQGLVSPDPKTGEYDAWRVAQMTVAKRAIELGVDEEALAGLMAFFSGEAAACAAMEEAAAAREAELDAKLAELDETRRRYEELQGAA